MEFKIEEPDKKIGQEIKANWDRVAKPLDGLGEFEGLLARIGAILGSPEIDIAKKAVIVMCADNGVVAEGISQSGQEITAAVTENLGKRNTSVCKMAQVVGAEIFPVDIGVNTDRIFPGVISRKVKKGTNDFLLKPAMSEREAMQAVRVGMELVKEWIYAAWHRRDGNWQYDDKCGDGSSSACRSAGDRGRTGRRIK